uniref:Neur_chan_LBD domain-containing protein n=1 Tax=Panagrellus redivivus TaxID=6233 RepID=A0A7E4US62_PANRE
MYGLKLALFFLCVVVTVAENSREASRLFEDLFNDYKRLNRPVKNATAALRIEVKLKLLQIVNVDEVNQIVLTNGWLIQKWHDYRLQWNPAEYGNVTMLHVPGRYIFLPDICLYNTASGSPVVTTITKADVYHTGHIVWEPPVTYESMCKIKVEWFPYDEQNCEIMLGSWTYSGTEIDMVHPETDVVQVIQNGNTTVWRVEAGMDISEYQESVEWDLMSIVGNRHMRYYPCCDYPVIDITYNINIRRKKLFYTVNLILPCGFLAMLTSTVFYLPCESHEKVTLCISILVSVTFFLLLLTEITPPTSIEAPLIGQYLLFTMIMVTLSIVMTVIIQNVHWRVEQPMPKIVRAVFIHFFGKYLLIFRSIGKKDFHRKARYKRPKLLTALHTIETSFETRKTQSCNCGADIIAQGVHRHRELGSRRASFSASDDIISRRRRSYTPPKPLIPPELQARINNMGKNIRYIERSLKRERQREELQADWQFVAMTIDRIMLIIFAVTITSGTVIATSWAPTLRDDRQPINTKAQSPWLAYESYLNPLNV